MEAVCARPFPLQKRFITPDQVYILYLLMHLVPFTKLILPLAMWNSGGSGCYRVHRVWDEQGWKEGKEDRRKKGRKRMNG